MSNTAVQTKINLINIFFVSLWAQVISITVDFSTCEKVNLTTIYPFVLKPQMRFYLFTVENLLEGEELQENDISSIKFNAEWPTRIFISGWKTTPQNCKTALLKDAYLRKGNFNFIVADWSDWGKREYILAVTNANTVGTSIGNFTKYLNKQYGVEFSDIYLIGHSIGAHIAGAAGKSIAPDKFKAIFGLDPSGPGFVGLSPANRLDPTDAEYVEVITTDMFYYGYGSRRSISHSTFYPNQGRRIQPSCPTTLSINIRDQFCSHAIAVDYFANSLNDEYQFCGIAATWNDLFLNRKPEHTGSCEFLMGGEPAIKKQGHFIVLTSESGPFPISY